MEPEPTVLDSLRRAVEAMPDDVPLRLHLATLLLRGGQREEAIRQLGGVLQRDPANTAALGLLREGLARLRPRVRLPRARRRFLPNGTWCVLPPPASGPARRASGGEAAGGRSPQYDWSQAEDELRDVLPAMFIGDTAEAGSASARLRRARRRTPMTPSTPG